MGWREALGLELEGVLSDLQHNPQADAMIMRTLRRVADALRAELPPADRIALARELLPPGFVVARDMPEEIIGLPHPEDYRRGWNAYRAAMMEGG